LGNVGLSKEANENMNEPNLTADMWEKINSIEGWLSYPAAHFTWALLRYQMTLPVDGPIVEFGVYKGKYLALMSAASASASAKVFGYDGFFAGYNEPLEEQWIEPARATMVRNVATVTKTSDRLTIVKANTQSIVREMFLDEIGGKISFASIDAGHEADEVFQDTQLISSALAPGGIIAADDVFNAACPGVAEGLCRFLAAQETPSISAFATVGNKVFFCTPEYHEQYRDFTKNLILSCRDPHLEGSKRHVQSNTDIGYAPTFFGFEIIPFAC